MMTDAESDSPGEQPRPTVSDGTYDDATSAFKENSLPSIQYAAEKDEVWQLTNSCGEALIAEVESLSDRS